MQLPDFLTEWPGGEIVLTGHRIGLYTIARFYDDGFTPEMLWDQFPSLSLALIHKVIAFYLENREDVEQYCAETAAEIERQEALPRKGPDLAELKQRAELRKRLEAKRRAESTWWSIPESNVATVS